MSATAESVAASIVRTQTGVVTTLRPTQPLTEDAVLKELHQSIEKALESGEHQIIIDLVGVPLLNSAALEEFLNFQDQLIRVGGWLKMSHASAIVREIFRITDVDKYISIVGEDAGNEGKREDAAPAAKRKRLGDLLVEAGLVTAIQVNEALEQQKKPASDSAASSSQRAGLAIRTCCNY